MPLYPQLFAVCHHRDRAVRRLARRLAQPATIVETTLRIAARGSQLSGSKILVTAGPTRRATGTHYTPRSLTEPIVQHTLEPLVYVGPKECKPREQWRDGLTLDGLIEELDRTVDFTGDMPVILGPDGPSLGGFVCPATVVAADRWKLGQLRPGDRVRFVPVAQATANAAGQAQAVYAGG